jgi:hypothetical protein
VQQHENARRRNPEADKLRRESRISEVSWSSEKMRREYERHNEVYSRSFIGRHDDPAGYQRRSSRRLLRALHREPRCIGLLTGERELHGDSMPNRERYETWETTTFTTWAIAEDAVQEWTAGTLSIQATFPNDALEKTAENVLIGGAEATEEARKIGEAVSIAGVMRRDGSDRLAEERTENAAAVRTAATSWFTEEALSHARSLRVARATEFSEKEARSFWCRDLQTGKQACLLSGFLSPHLFIAPQWKAPPGLSPEASKPERADAATAKPVSRPPVPSHSPCPVEFLPREIPKGHFTGARWQQDD